MQTTCLSTEHINGYILVSLLYFLKLLTFKSRVVGYSVFTFPPPLYRQLTLSGKEDGRCYFQVAIYSQTSQLNGLSIWATGVLPSSRSWGFFSALGQSSFQRSKNCSQPIANGGSDYSYYSRVVDICVISYCWCNKLPRTPWLNKYSHGSGGQKFETVSLS